MIKSRKRKKILMIPDMNRGPWQVVFSVDSRQENYVFLVMNTAPENDVTKVFCCVTFLPNSCAFIVRAQSPTGAHYSTVHHLWNTGLPCLPVDGVGFH